MFVASENRLKIVQNAILFIDQINEYEDKSYNNFLIFRLEIFEIVIVKIDQDNLCKSMIIMII